VSEKYNDYAKNVLNLLNNSDIRTLIDDRNEKVGKKIRDNELKRIPYLIVVGENEQNDGTVSVRKQGEGNGAVVMKIDEFVSMISKEVADQMNEMK
jgi:threonyl-tRNA synthetase